jgi:hypothetical protein
MTSSWTEELKVDETGVGGVKVTGRAGHNALIVPADQFVALDGTLGSQGFGALLVKLFHQLQCVGIFRRTLSEIVRTRLVRTNEGCGAQENSKNYKARKVFRIGLPQTAMVKAKSMESWRL